jgi:hypothetical protein
MAGHDSYSYGNPWCRCRIMPFASWGRTSQFHFTLPPLTSLCPPLCFLSFHLFLSEPSGPFSEHIPSVRAVRLLKSVLLLAPFAPSTDSLINAASLCAGAARAPLSGGYWKQKQDRTRRSEQRLLSISSRRHSERPIGWDAMPCSPVEVH